MLSMTSFRFVWNLHIINRILSYSLLAGGNSCVYMYSIHVEMIYTFESVYRSFQSGWLVKSCCMCAFGFWNRSIACGDRVCDYSWAGAPEHLSGFSAGKPLRPSPNYRFSAFVHFYSIFSIVRAVRRTVKTTYITLSHGDTPPWVGCLSPSLSG